LKKKSNLQVLIPACAESDWLPQTLASLNHQREADFEVWVCVNHAPSASEAIKADNQATLKWLRSSHESFAFPLHVRDATGDQSPDKGQAGVGWARDDLARQIIEARGKHSIIVSLDADTLLDPNYLTAVQHAFTNYPKAVGLTAPYFHHVPEDPQLAFGLLRYELYMRYYQLQLWRIGCPYAFLPLGSAMAFRGDAFLKIGGIPHRQAGEDFYFLSKLRKMGPIIRWIPARVYPASRPSHRVPFGTGALITSALAIQQQRFPFYDPADFDRIAATYECWPDWFVGEVADFPLRDFWQQRLGGEAAIDRMRQNARDLPAFIRACHEKLDGLRVLQALRFYREGSNQPLNDRDALRQCLEAEGLQAPEDPFQDVETMAAVRQQMAEREASYQKAYMAEWNPKSRW
jgi:cellulose synthase/poly-beta-1,6-N-acetylglucosamine synthase-like glycosyltransferase